MTISDGGTPCLFLRYTLYVQAAHQEGLRKGAEVTYLQQQMKLHRQKALEHEVTVGQLKCAYIKQLV